MAAARNVSAAHSSTERSSLLEALRQFADGGGLARAVHAHHQDHGRRLGDARRRALAGLQNFEQLLANQPLQFGGVAQLVAVHALADALENLVGRAHADVGRDERVLQLVEQVGVDFLLARRTSSSAETSPARVFWTPLFNFSAGTALARRNRKASESFCLYFTFSYSPK